ncbi:helix-turn-helix transcriptional regulator [Nocardioides coralli]|uniref:helix-turn-helix transcriptional regulator n=1 Tax=Nocardioides coralli TaxID=2872154 RepID=UPI001CA463ED|nr:helix-turn-helix transcriptional regulator [Nocardioides coralli]QZY28243.1 helix-turn-helix transcriptional regulator [Nocardioides coralli]
MTLSRSAALLRSRVLSATTAAADCGDFRSRVLAAIRTVVPFDGGCLAATDPATLLPTALTTVGFDSPEAVMLAAASEYGADPPANSFSSLSRLGTPVRISREVGEGAWRHSHHYTDLLAPFGLCDEVRMVFRARDGRAWGMATLSRAPGRPFDDEAARTLGASLGVIGEGMRRTLLRHSWPEVSPGGGGAPDEEGPAVVVLRDNVVEDLTPEAARVLQRIGWGGAAPVALAGLRYRHHGTDSVRVRTHSGTWVVLRVGELGDDRLAVTIERARPPEVVALMAAVHGLTARETEVLAKVLAGQSRGAIGRDLHISAWTVQDHLKSIYAKTGVNSRQALVAQLVFDQYLPRIGTPLGPGGWFVDTPAESR